MATAHRIAAPTELKIGKIGVLTDFSPEANTDLRFAATLARSYSAGIVLTHAYLPPSGAFRPRGCAGIRGGRFAQAKSRKQAAQGHPRTVAQRHSLHDRALPGRAVDLLAELNDADVIVVGTSGATGLRKALLGSTAEMVFRISGKLC